MSNNTPDYQDNLYFEPKGTLTEQWKHKELPVGSYYASYLGEPRVWLYRDKQNQTYDLEYEIYEVLAKVPSFEEWKEKLRALDAAYETIKMEDETINRLVRSGKQCNYENSQLKEVLHIIKRQCELLMPKNGLNPVGDRAVMKMFLNKIDEVLK